MRIAVLEDNPPDASLVEAWLDGAGHGCQLFATSRDLMDAFGAEEFDLVLLDWELPDIDGERVLRWLRKNVGWELPVVFVTARDDSDDVVAMLDAGADDYVTKPVDFKQLLARIAALGRRAGLKPAIGDVVESGALKIDVDAHRITLRGGEVELTPKEFALATALLNNIGTLLSRQDLLREIWGYGAEINTRTIDVHVSRLRKKLDLVPEQGWRLTSVHHAGYRLDRLLERLEA